MLFMDTLLREDTRTQEHYWNRMAQFKFDLNYYSYYFSFCVRFLRCWKIAISALTALVTGAWMNWGENTNVKLVCAILILLFQGLNAASELFPFENRKRELREMKILLEPVYEDMEADWLRIAEGEMSKEEVAQKFKEYDKKKRDILQHYFKDDDLPDNKQVREKAKRETDMYIQNNFL